MRKNIAQLRRLSYCKILHIKRKYFSAELSIRQGRYLLRLDYNVHETPRVYIITPEINMTDPTNIHTFGLKYHGSYNKDLPWLCLTYNKLDNWDPSIPLLESYIPWAIEWTEFYELWVLTGIWFGKEIHLPNKCEESNGDEN